MHKIINSLKTEFKWQAGILITATFILYAFLVNNLNLWTDEIYSVLMAKDNFHDMWTLLINEDSKPPLYYLYLKIILHLFPAQLEIWAAHFGSVLLLILAQIFTATAIRHDFGDKTALWMIILIMMMPQSFWLGLEVRTYMLSALLMMMVAVYGLRLIHTPQDSDFVKFGICSILSLYTHYYCAIWMMFFYLGLFYLMMRNQKLKNTRYRFLLTAILVGILFLPWLFVPLQNGQNISQSWYVSLGFVDASWHFFVNPLFQEVMQSMFFIATTLSASVLSFILILGVFGLPQKKSASAFKLLFGSFIASYAFLLILSYTVRPMVTERYLKIFSLILYFAAALVLTQQKNIQKAFFFVAIIGFIFTYADVRAISFDKGYQNFINVVRKHIPNDQPLIAFDQTNLFCEYYLPEYKCLLIIGEKGEFFRLPKVAQNTPLYQQTPAEMSFGLSLYRLRTDGDCQTYTTQYRNGQNIYLCHYRREEIQPMLQDSLKWLKKRLETP